MCISAHSLRIKSGQIGHFVKHCETNFGTNYNTIE